MLKHIAKTAIAVVFGLALADIASCQLLDTWLVREIYSNADGSVQFIKFEFDIDRSLPPNITGQTLIASNGSTQRSFTLSHDRPNPCFLCTGGDSTGFLVATQGFADLNVGKPDFVVPNGFAFTTDGTVKFGASEIHYDALPTDGLHALYPHGLFWGEGIADAPVIGTPIAIGIFLPGRNAVVEYHDVELDDYFLTAYPSEIDALDAGRLPGWQRTTDTFAAWTGAFSLNAADNPPPNLLPVCRVWLGDSHFYSISATECTAVARFPAFLETNAAFFATLPNPDTGACPADQASVFRLWNPRGSNHRYTTQTAVRDDMQARGWLAEGYGPDSVAMCTGGKAQ